MAINLLAKLRSSCLVLHDLRVHVCMSDLILVLVVHLLLSVPLLCSCVGRLISSDVATNLVILEALLIIALCRPSKVSVALLVLLVALVGVSLWAGDAWLAPVLSGGRILCLFIVFRAVCWPIDSIAERLATAAEDWEGPKVAIATKDLFPILLRRDVIQALVWVSFHFKILDCRLIRQGKFNVELEEHGHQDSNDSIEHECDLNYNVLRQQLLILRLRAIVVRVETPLDALEPGVSHSHDDEVSDNKHVDQQENEKFAIPKSDTVIDPGAVMVHVQHTSIAGGAVMAAFGLEYVAHETVSTTLVLWVTQMESPEDRHLTWIGRH